MRLAASGKELPLWLWLWFPLAVLSVSLAIKTLDSAAYYQWVIGEWGAVENITLVVLFAAVVFAAKVLLSVSAPAPPWLRYWALLIGLGSVYFLGEEASWGQHLMGWSPSEDWGRLNQQNETNLHNIKEFGFLFDQLPRNLLSAAAILGGVVVPVYRYLRSLEWTPQQVHYWLWPTFVCTPSALIAVLISVPQKLYKAAGEPLPELLVGLNPGELKECFLAVFIMLYLAALASRIARSRTRPAPGTAA